MRNRLRTSVLAALAAGLLVPLPAAGEDATVKIAREDCGRLVRHRPAADAEYKPGVDVRGRKVVPADLGGGAQWKVPDVITIDIGIDLEEKYGLGAGGKYTGEAVVAEVEVNSRTGEVTIDGKPLEDPLEAAIAAACEEAYGK